jgi:hypothetical protein
MDLVEEDDRAGPGARLTSSGGGPLLPPLTRTARRVLWITAGLFVLFVSLRLNGSSIACLRTTHWSDLVLQDAPSGVLLSSPKMIRSDEWLVWTPAIVAQARQIPAFPSSNPSLGPPKTPLLMSIPARDYTMFLRPQLWGYFLLPVDYGFAWNWNFKAFALFAAMFLLFWRVTDGNLGLSLFGGLAVLFSPLVQWWFSSPSMLPEMLTYWALGLGAALRLFANGAPAADTATERGRAKGSAWTDVTCVLVLAVSLANGMLCCYPPFEIVLFHLGLFMVAGYVWQHRLLTVRGVCLGLAALAAAAALLVPWFVECYDTLQVVAHTVYPGQRQCFGGGLTLVRLFSGFFGLALTQTNTPAALENVCEASSFYPFWLLPLGLGLCAFARVLIRVPSSALPWLSARGLQVSLAAYLVVFALFAVVPFPHWFCHLTLLTRTIEVRGLAGIGLAGTLLVALTLASAPVARVSWQMALPAGLVWCAGVLAFLLWQRPALLAPPANTPFLTPGRLLGLEGAAVAFGFVYLLAPRPWALMALAGPFVLKTALINPLCVGLPELLRSRTLNEVHAIVQAEPKAQWVSYSSLCGVEALKSTGAPVVNGLRVIPDPALIHTLDPNGENTAAYNRYAHLIFEPANDTREVSARLLSNVFCIVAISAPKVRELFPRVKFIAAWQPSPDLEAAGFRLWKRWPEDHLWLYRLSEKQSGQPSDTQPAAPPAA